MNPDDLLMALIDIRVQLYRCYDATEDNDNNPCMQKIGNALTIADAVIKANLPSSKWRN